MNKEINTEKEQNLGSHLGIRIIAVLLFLFILFLIFITGNVETIYAIIEFAPYIIGAWIIFIIIEAVILLVNKKWKLAIANFTLIIISALFSYFLYNQLALNLF